MFRYYSHSGSDSIDLYFMLFLFAIFGFLGICGAFENIQRKKRSKAFSNYCLDKGFSYQSEAMGITGQTARFDFYKKGEQNNFLDLVYDTDKNNNEINVAYMETYVFTRNKHGQEVPSRTGTYSVVHIRRPGVVFPKFFIRKENAVLDNLGSMLGGQDIDFADDKAFSDSFVLQGEVEASVRSFFTRSRRQVFLKNHQPGLEYEGNEDCFIMYKDGIVSLDERDKMMKRAVAIFNAIATKPKPKNEQQNITLNNTLNNNYYNKNNYY